MLFGGESGDCPHCSKGVRFVQQGSLKAVHPDTGASVGQTMTAVCPNCTGIVVFVTADNEWTTWVRHPAPKPVIISGTPDRVAEAYSEAQLALGVGAPHAAATMLRRAIASAATHFGVPDANETGGFIGLGKRIDGLKERLLPVTLGAAHETKLLGDGGAHEENEDKQLADELGPIDAETVARAVVVVGLILSNLFEIPTKVASVRQGAATKDAGGI